MYDDVHWELYEQMHSSGSALQILDHLASTIPTSDGLTSEALRTSIDSMRSWIGQRTTALAQARAG